MPPFMTSYLNTNQCYMIFLKAYGCLWFYLCVETDAMLAVSMSIDTFIDSLESSAGKSLKHTIICQSIDETDLRDKVSSNCSYED